MQQAACVRPERKSALQFIEVLLLLSLISSSESVVLGKYNPCNAPGLATRVRFSFCAILSLGCDDFLTIVFRVCTFSYSNITQGRGFYVGIAMWPGGSVANWGSGINADTAVPGLHPCNATNNYNNTGLSDAAYLVTYTPSHVTFESTPGHMHLNIPSDATMVPYFLQCVLATFAFEGQVELCTQASKGVVVASFELKMDVLMAMNINSSDIDRLFESISNASTSLQHEVISAVVFRFGAEASSVSFRNQHCLCWLWLSASEAESWTVRPKKIWGSWLQGRLQIGGSVHQERGCLPVTGHRPRTVTRSVCCI